MNDNIDITKKELRDIRNLPDFDLTMILSEIHDHGWPLARKTLQAAVLAIKQNKNQSTDKRA